MWIIAPLAPGASRADWEWHRDEVYARERELRDVWTNVCLMTGLTQVIPTPGHNLQAPLVGRIRLDCAPVCFSVKLRPGQLPEDVAQRADRIAAAFRVPSVEVVTITRDLQWISVRLIEPYWIEWSYDDALEAGDDRPVVEAVPQAGELPAAETVRVVDAPVSGWSAVRRFFTGAWRLPDAAPDPVRPASP
ncbi:hypothetical protein WCD74_29600 [Actinomycetospora sp. OC33-EN08]|uniref:Uncharacterized protein n=1 Tax=Actinomycetospora aurantiaca TaxID=3129233 RepID=A0ABU8MXP4_9PSEU